jgi:hypothetical protein
MVPAVILNDTLQLPAGSVTAAGTVIKLELEVRETRVLEETGAQDVSVQLVVCPDVKVFRLLGLHDNERIVVVVRDPTSVSDADCDEPL